MKQWEIIKARKTNMKLKSIQFTWDLYGFDKNPYLRSTSTVKQQQSFFPNFCRYTICFFYRFILDNLAFSPLK